MKARRRMVICNYTLPRESQVHSLRSLGGGVPQRWGEDDGMCHEVRVMKGRCLPVSWTWEAGNWVGEVEPLQASKVLKGSLFMLLVIIPKEFSLLHFCFSLAPWPVLTCALTCQVALSSRMAQAIQIPHPHNGLQLGTQPSWPDIGLDCAFIWVETLGSVALLKTRWDLSHGEPEGMAPWEGTPLISHKKAFHSTPSFRGGWSQEILFPGAP